ncbi:MAG: 2TM domain-containing protein [Planctomycetaceae bacterium]|nr:2TM domain-containing protein [Planctomycetaceae bacterium]
MTAIHDIASRGTPRMRTEFRNHLIAYLVVNAGLCALDVLTGTDKLWFFWVIGGWGIGLAAHAYRVFGPGAAQPHRTETPSNSRPTQHGNATDD